MLYREIKPSPILADFVKLIWIQEAGAAESHWPPERIVTDGIIELVFHFGDPFLTHYANGDIEPQPTGFIIAQLNKPILIQPTGRAGILAVRFHPWGGYHFFDAPIRECPDQPFPVEYVWPGKGRQLCERICCAPDNAERVRIITRFLIARLADSHKYHAASDKVIKLILQQRGQMTVKDITETTGFGERALERHFNASVGVSPKQFSRITRFLHTCNFIKNHRHKSLTQITYECGYYDQAHLIREFKQFAGITPREFFASQDTSFFTID